MPQFDTIQFKEQYKDLDTTLYWLVQQAITSIPYCQKKWGENNSLQKIWTIGNQNLIYKNDAKNIEQIQSVGTMFENNIHNIEGAGDCDCFTVFTIAMLLANGYNSNNINIFLQGRNKKMPVHVLTMYEKDKEKYYFDFTEPIFNKKRKYNYFDIVPINLYL